MRKFHESKNTWWSQMDYNGKTMKQKKLTEFHRNTENLRFKECYWSHQIISIIIRSLWDFTDITVYAICRVWCLEQMNSNEFSCKIQFHWNWFSRCLCCFFSARPRIIYFFSSSSSLSYYFLSPTFTKYENTWCAWRAFPLL